MSVTQYIGARYVPLFADPIDWDSTRQYEPLTIVYYQGNSYTSKQAVPSGIDIANTQYWVLTGNYNAQIEQYRTEVQSFNGRISANAQAIADEVAARMAEDTDLTNAIAAEESARIAADTALENTIEAEESARIAADNGIIEAIKNQHIIGGYVAPEYAGSFMADEQFGSCLRYLDTMIAFNPYNDGSGNGDIRIYGIANNTLTSKLTGKSMGHANSCCYDPVRDTVYVAGLFNGVVGDNTPDPNIYMYNISGVLKGTTQVPAAQPVGSVSYDSITETLYAFAGYNNTWHIYRMTREENAFTEWKTIPYSEFRVDDDMTEQYWQDIAVYDDMAIFCKYEGTCYSVNLISGEMVSTFRIGSDDAGGTWHFGEHEGLEFDTRGNLYQARNGITGITNANKTHEINCCFITNVNTAVNIEQSQMRRHAVYETYYASNEYANTLVLPRGQVQNPNQLMYLQRMPSRLVVESGKTLDCGKVRFTTDINFDISGIVNCTNIDAQKGTFILRVRNTGTLNMNKAGTDREYAIAFTDRPVTAAIRNEGNINIQGYTKLASGGALPVLIGYTGSGLVNGSNTCSINEATNVQAGRLIMGAYNVYQYGV